MTRRIAVLDDKPANAALILEALETVGLPDVSIEAFTSVGEFRVAVASWDRLDLVLSDVFMPTPDDGAMALLRWLEVQRRVDPRLATVQVRLLSMESDASPFVHRLVGTRSPWVQFLVPSLNKKAWREHDLPRLVNNALPAVGCPSAPGEWLERLDRYAQSEVNLLLLGEMGSGKSFLAKRIHEKSRRSRGPLIEKNCATLDPGLAGSDLFGHIKGAATGLTARKTGLFEAAEGGTLFLDEVGHLALAVQAMLLGVLEGRTYQTVGVPSQVSRARVRLVTATNADLGALARSGAFLETLLSRLGEPIRIPPLRERAHEIPGLLQALLPDVIQETRPVQLSEAAIEVYRAHSWPTNVRGLRDALRRLCLDARGEVATADDARASLVERGTMSSPPSELDAEERRTLDAMVRSNGNRAAAARELGMTREAVRRRIGRSEGLRRALDAMGIRGRG